MAPMRPAAAVLVLIAALGIGACGSDDSDNANTEVQKTKSGVMIGPEGDKAVPVSDLKLTDEDVQELQDGNYTAAMALHETDTDLPNVAREAMEERLNELGIDLVAVTDAEFDAAKQKNDIETILARKPDALISIPVDPTTTASAYREAEKAGVKLVFWDFPPDGFKHPKDYVGVVSSDQIATGENTAQIMCDAVGDEGKIGVIFYDADFFITNQRDAAFKDSLAQQCPDVAIVAEEGFEDPGRVESVASAMITRNPDLNGIYASWAKPAEGVLAALREAGRDDVKVATVDLSAPFMIDVAEGGPAAGASADFIAEIGVGMANAAALGILGKDVPAFSVVSSIPVTKENILEGWEKTYDRPAPKAVQDAVAENSGG